MRLRRPHPWGMDSAHGGDTCPREAQPSAVLAVAVMVAVETVEVVVETVEVVVLAVEVMPVEVSRRW